MSLKTEQELKEYLMYETKSCIIQHSDRDLYSHLCGTWDYLNQWGCTLDTRKAGLFHSAYGTEFFQINLFNTMNRGKLQDLIGLYAEIMVHNFCITKRSELKEKNLILIELANALDQHLKLDSILLNRLGAMDKDPMVKRALESL